MPETGDTCEYLKDIEIVPAMVILFNSPVCVVTESKWVPENDSVLWKYIMPSNCCEDVWYPC